MEQDKVVEHPKQNWFVITDSRGTKWLKVERGEKTEGLFNLNHLETVRPLTNERILGLMGPRERIEFTVLKFASGEELPLESPYDEVAGWLTGSWENLHDRKTRN